MSAWTRRGLAAALGLALLGVGAVRSGDARSPGQAGPVPTGQAGPVPTGAGAAPSAGQARPLTGVPMGRPTRLRLLLPHWFLDIDATGPTGAQVPVAVTGWLPVSRGAPLLIEDARGPEEFGRIQVTALREPRLPGGPRVVRLTGPVLGAVAAGHLGAGLWLAEYQDRTRCTLRLVNLAGGDLRAPRQVPCGLRPIIETVHGLWAEVGPDAFAAAATPADVDAVLLDPDTLTERLRVSRIELVDEHRVVVFTDRLRDTVELRDLRSGRVTPLTPPTTAGHLSVWPVSPDGRHLPFSFDTPESDPQHHDVWLLDVSTMAWVHAPSMPAYASLKRTSLAWAPDGRLVLLGEFAESGALVVTWRPGEPALSLLAYRRPATPVGRPADDRFLVLPSG